MMPLPPPPARARRRCVCASPRHSDRLLVTAAAPASDGARRQLRGRRLPSSQPLACALLCSRGSRRSCRARIGKSTARAPPRLSRRTAAPSGLAATGQPAPPTLWAAPPRLPPRLSLHLSLRLPLPLLLRLPLRLSVRLSLRQSPCLPLHLPPHLPPLLPPSMPLLRLQMPPRPMPPPRFRPRRPPPPPPPSARPSRPSPPRLARHPHRTELPAHLLPTRGCHRPSHRLRPSRRLAVRRTRGGRPPRRPRRRRPARCRRQARCRRPSWILQGRRWTRHPWAASASARRLHRTMP